MSRLALPAVLAAAILAGCGGGGGAGAGAAPPRTAGQGDPFSVVFRLVEQWRQGWQVRSFDALAPLYRHDDHTVIVYQGRAQRGWASAQTWLRSQLAGAAVVHLRLEDGVVTTTGADSATFAARMDREVSDGVVTTTDAGFLTLTLIRVDDAWAIVAEHYSYQLGGS